MPAPLANQAAALAEGYFLTQTDRGVGNFVRYQSVYSKPIDCDGSSGCIRQAVGMSTVDQPTADAAALANLNAIRGYVYGTDATNVNKGAKSGSTLVVGKH